MLSGRGCTEERKAECRARSGSHLEALCRSCNDKDFSVSPYVSSLYVSCLLLEAGFPVSQETFDIDYWTDLGIFRIALKAKMRIF